MLVNIITIFIFIVLFIVFGILGYILGRLSYNTNTQQMKSLKSSIQSSEFLNTTKIDIDERKVITKIDTEGLEKKYSQLGDRTVSDSDISSSVDKLKKLKK